MLSDETLKRYFLEELDYLRHESVKFAGEFPEIANELTLNREAASDPQIEMMLQSFAYLTGKMRYQMDLDDALLPNQLLASLSPHIEAPWPATSVVEFEVKKGNFANPQVIGRHTPLSTDVSIGANQYPCKFATVYDTEVWPIKVSKISFPAANGLSYLKDSRNSHPFTVSDSYGVMAVKLSTEGNYEFNSFPMTCLPFYLNGGDRFKLYEFFQRHFVGAIVYKPKSKNSGQTEGTLQKLSQNCISFKGFGKNDGITPDKHSINPGLASLREYLLFPDKFLFGTLDHIDCSAFEKDMEIYFFFDKTFGPLSEECFKVNCTPVVNLYSQAIEPINLVSTKLEYQATGDQFFHAQNEIHSIEELKFLSPDGKVLPIYPLYGEQESDQGYWVARREPSQLPSITGTETYLRFVDNRFEPLAAAGMSVVGRAWCTNRSLPEKLPIDCPLQLDIPAAVTTARLIKRPNRHQTPELSGDQSRRLVAHLNSHFLPLSGPNGLDVLKQLISQHARNNQPDVKKQLSGILKLQTSKAGHLLGEDAWRGYCHGTLVEIELDESKFDTTSVMLFGHMLNEVLANFAPINSFVKLCLRNRKDELIHMWPARVGDQCLL